ncbi:hypothetical protein MPTK1_8g05580 [Marchantia polymorpha subsp. ruderalis]|uniref:AAA+ ATPase domain-containing protein n=2 Tax=Marchantia polymorpha TaxID=3197 RepID=A0A176VC03_MARPO|nr:hypothetical protein AXG93_1783s1130 [Marchantia polymorpha subsp. ruderalis]PTQ34335.1 hypothetical protein MARPO_0081s0059 [Marchantia polymorpha]BBN18797.1 hypothetical protein Mp_8g05580 [Marchantia polymorpha subsp. ruderalis]|eukprot:PTQ34335.1 hypothetical protein MARPO_0081s0059 [Marchantia polymorpha]
MTTQAVQIGSCTPAFSGCCEVGKNLRRPGCQLAFWSSLRTLNVSGDAFRSSSLAGKTAGTFHCQRRREALVVRVRNGGPSSESNDPPHKMAWIGGSLSRDDSEEAKKKAEESALKLLMELKEQEIKETEAELQLERQAVVQLEREHIQSTMWNKFLLKARGELKGTMWDPEDSHPIPYSEFSRLLDEERVNYLEYAEFGKDVAVVLPYYKEDEPLTVQLESSEVPSTIEEALQKKEFPRADEREIVYRRHPVEQMPADGWGEAWTKLHKQLYHVEIRQPNSLPAQLYPTMETAVVWGMRVALALLCYKWIDKKLYPWYKLPNPENRPVFRRPKLSVDNLELGSLGQSRARFISAEESTGVTFDDFAGQEYVKRELEEVVRILKDGKEFEELGIYCPKGVLLYGPPGTGKTLLAKAIAGEAGVPFFSASGSEFVEMFVGVAAARVRDLFARARQFAPSIVFIDEIDAIGAKRGGPDIGGGGVEREQGLIQILTELDGFQSSNAKVMVVGATNRLDMLDPALLRKGRFDKTISVGLPTEEGRLAILRVHARNKGFNSEEEKEELLKEIAQQTYEFSGAELQNVLNEAAILAARKDKDIVERAELLEALKRQEGTFATGEEDVVDASGEARMRIAYREAAIALLECYFPNPWRPFTKTNVRNIDTYPNMEFSEPKNRVFSRKEDMVNHIVRACAPRIVEEQIFGRDHLSWISGSALGEAGVLADYLILRTGMTALGKVYYRTQQDLMIHLGPKVVALRDEYMRWAVEKCHSILKEYRSALETIAELLMDKEEITAAEIWEIFKKAPRIPQPEVRPVDEYAAIIYAGRWGVQGISLSGRATFKPGNIGYVTFAAPRPQQLKVIKDETWRMLDQMRETNMAKIAEKFEEKEEVGTVISPQQFL